MRVSSQCCLPCLECLDLPEWSDLDDIEDVIDNEFLSLSKLWSGEGEGNLGGWDLWYSPSPIAFMASRGMTGHIGGSQNHNLQTRLSVGKLCGH